MEYTPTRLRCADSEGAPCQIKSHRHELDPARFQKNRAGDKYEQSQTRRNAEQIYAARLFDATENGGVVVNLDEQPEPIKDLYNICKKYFNVYVNAMKSASFQISSIENAVRYSAIFSEYPTNELDEMASTSRENVRDQFTAARDVVASEFGNQMHFFTQKCIDAGMLRTEARAIVPLAMKAVFESYMSHLDDCRLLRDSINCLNTVKI